MTLNRKAAAPTRVAGLALRLWVLGAGLEIGQSADDWAAGFTARAKPEMVLPLGTPAPDEAPLPDLPAALSDSASRRRCLSGLAILAI